MYNIPMGTKHIIIQIGKVKITIIDTNDHNPPHVHVYAPGATAKINIESGRVVSAKGFTKHALTKISKAVRKNSKVLLEKWEEFYGEKED
jgi:hypothetical protein